MVGPMDASSFVTNLYLGEISKNKFDSVRVKFRTSFWYFFSVKLFYIYDPIHLILKGSKTYLKLI